MKRLDDIKARAAAATEGPWMNLMLALVPVGRDGNIADTACEDSVGNRVNNAEFVAHARTDVPVLVAAVEAVLELHEEVGNEGKPGCDCGCGGYEPWCKCGDYTYPCPTVVAIQSALGEVG